VTGLREPVPLQTINSGKLSDAWLNCLKSDIYSFRVTSIFKSVIDDAARQFDAEAVLVDVGPSLGAINRAVSISSDYIISPVTSDLFSLQAIKNLDTTLYQWKHEWMQRKELMSQHPIGLNERVHRILQNKKPRLTPGLHVFIVLSGQFSNHFLDDLNLRNCSGGILAAGSPRGPQPNHNLIIGEKSPGGKAGNPSQSLMNVFTLLDEGIDD